MLGPRDALIAQIAKSLGLVNDAGLARVTDLKKRFPQRALEQLLVDTGLLDKAGYAKLAAAFQSHAKGAGKPGAAARPPAKPAKPPERSPTESGSDEALIVPDEEDQRALGRLGNAARANPDPLATPPSEDTLGSDSDLTVAGEDAILSEPTLRLKESGEGPAADEDAILAEPTMRLRDDDARRPAPKPGKPPEKPKKPEPTNEDAILAEPTLMLRDDELKPRPPGGRTPAASGRAPAAPPGRKPPPRPKQPDEDASLAEPTLMMPDEELRAAPRRPEPALELAADSSDGTEDEILAEPTLIVPKDEDSVPALSKDQERQILSEPTVMLGDDELKRAPGDFQLDLVPEAESKESGTGGFFASGAPADLAVPDDLVAGAAPVEPKGPQPGVKKKAKGGVLDRKEFERRSKLRMGFEGMHVGDYEIVGELSRGAFGVVLKVKPEGPAKSMARERGFEGEFMAMKVMLATGDPEESRRFMDEVKVLITLVHPNIIRIFDAGVERELKYYTMELIDGVDSRSLVREQGGKLPVLYAVRIAKDVAAALAIVHARTVYHRDLKPANIMIDRAHKPHRTVLIDFGLVAERKEGKSDDGLILGTPSYMPPEQAKPKGGFGEVNGTSDIYSLGATFYFLMTGQSPFPGKDPREIIKRVCSEPPPSPVTLNPEIPKSIAAICMKCLAKNQRERYVAARLLEQELEKELNAAQLKLKAKGFVRKLFGGGGGGAAPKA